MKRLTVAAVAASLAACASQEVGHGNTVVADEADDYRISVEIPLGELGADDGAEGRIVKVDELLSERTGFSADDFALDEVVLVARSASGEGGNAELLVLEWRSGLFAVPEGGEEDWFEVRLPAPEDDLGGAWLLDLTGAVTVDTLVAVLEPKPRVVEVVTTRTRTIYRDLYPRTHYVHWLYDPTRYYVYHDYGGWPYRYFIGPWNYRYYDLAYRPYRYHYGPIFRAWHRERAGARGYRDGRDVRSGERNRNAAAVSAERRRISPELVKLRRSHPRLRTVRQRPVARAERQVPVARNQPARTGVAREAAQAPRPRAVARDRRAIHSDALEHRRVSRVGELRRSRPERRSAANEAAANERVAAPRRSYSRPASTSAESAARSPRPVRRDASVERPRPSARQRVVERPARRENPRAAAVRSERSAGGSPRLRNAPSQSRSAPARATAPVRESRAASSPRRVHSRDVQRQVQRRSSAQPRNIERPARRAAPPARAQRPAARAEPRRAARQERPSSREARTERSSAPTRTRRAAESSRRDAGPAFERR